MLIRSFKALPFYLPKLFFPPCANAVKKITIVRSVNNPLITPDSHRTLGDNINGPSVIRVPPWIKKPFGRYYMYFGHHKGRYIRLAYANTPDGPFRIYEPGALQLTQVRQFSDHIASPDVHVDVEKQQIRMYFHGVAEDGTQKTGVAFSRNGIDFQPSDAVLGNFYFRVFKYNRRFYAVCKNGALSGQLLYSQDGVSPFKKMSNFILDMRHAAVLTLDDLIVIFYTRTGDAPERIFLATLPPQNGIRAERLSRPIEVLRPEQDYEGIKYPVKRSQFGSATNVCQLRDPAVLQDGERTYLYYSIAGETGIAAAEVKIHFY